MSLSTPSVLASSGLVSSGLPITAQTNLPASVRNGSSADKAAYAEGLQFEQVLVNQLTQQLSQTVSDTSEGSTDDGADGSSGSSGGLFGAGSDQSEYSSLINQTLSSAIMSGGGVGIASEIARAIDPTFGQSAAGKTKGTAA